MIKNKFIRGYGDGSGYYGPLPTYEDMESLLAEKAKLAETYKSKKKPSAFESTSPMLIPFAESDPEFLKKMKKCKRQQERLVSSYDEPVTKIHPSLRKAIKALSGKPRVSKKESREKSLAIIQQISEAINNNPTVMLLHACGQFLIFAKHISKPLEVTKNAGGFQPYSSVVEHKFIDIKIFRHSGYLFKEVPALLKDYSIPEQSVAKLLLIGNSMGEAVITVEPVLKYLRS